MTSPNVAPPKPLLLAAFGIVYIVWGSTYLAIRFAVETLPPFTMAGLRFFIAGLLLVAWTGSKGVERPTRVHWRTASIISGLMLVAGNGVLAWAEQTVPSGIAALLVAFVPVWMVILAAVRPGGTRPSRMVVLGLILGLLGLVLLIGPSQVVGGAGLDRIGAWAIVFAAFAWALGSVYASTAPQHPSAFLSAGLQMVTGGAMLLVLGFLLGERIAVATVTLQSALALAYLIVFGSIVAYTAYNWLLRNADTAKVSTYAYVNPIVAVFLGWGLAGEVLSVRVAVAAAIIVGAVALIITAKARKGAATAPRRLRPRVPTEEY
ncbi:MAG: EamA family transporter [Rhodothermaceae bacterium]|nr:EamA family transporter [Rhodothermaceae bacterium]